jgi:hypothetical protein
MAYVTVGEENSMSKGAPHGLCWTHANEIDDKLVRFFR